MLTCIHQKAYVRMFIEAPFITEYTGSYTYFFNSRMDKLWDIHIMKYYMALRANNLQLYTPTWFTLTNGKQKNPDTKSTDC